MYKNIGGKIKQAAYIVFFLQIILYAVMGWLLLSVDMISCLLVIYFGLLISWFSSLFIYGFGELIDKVSSIERSCTLGSSPELTLKELKRQRDAGIISEEKYLEQCAEILRNI